MAILQAVSNFWNSWSPLKTHQKRDKEFKVPIKPVRALPIKKARYTPKAKELSPQSRVKVWSVRTPSPQSDIDVDHTLLPPSPPASTKQAYDDLEGDTLLPESPSDTEYDKMRDSMDEWNANEDTMVVDDDQYMDSMVNVDQERERRDRQGRELRDAGWSEDAVFLFQKLGLRGFEPILPIDWINDLETLPEDLFTVRLDKAFLRPAHGSDYHAQVALNNLFDLGGFARDAKLTRARQRTPAFHIKRAVTKYTRWAMKDGEVEHLWSKLPLFRVVTWAANIHASVGEREMIAKLGELHDSWQEALQIKSLKERANSAVPEVPTLYGITASHTVMAFVSYAPPTEENERPQLRLIAMFDFGKEGYDVWNSLAIAIFITHCRNRMMQLKESLPAPMVQNAVDPDL